MFFQRGTVKEHKVDLLVIGSGPGGQKAAIQAAKLGKKVIVIEKDDFIGGASLNSGTIPSKSLREAILVLTNFYRRSFYAEPQKLKEISINDLNFTLTKTLRTLREQLDKQFKKNHIQVLHGLAKFYDETKVIVYSLDGIQTDLIIAEKIIIATGSKPRNPENIPFDDKKILDSTRLLSIDYLPKSLIVLGGGIIGCEYASFFSALGTKVYVCDKGKHLLPYLDREIGSHLLDYLRNLDLMFHGEKVFDYLEEDEDGVTVYFTDGTSLKAEMFLYALGREANVNHLEIDKAGISLDQKGFIPVNSLFQTKQPHIYAVGDVIGPPSLAATSMEQGRLAARHAFGERTHHFPSFFPIGIYTIPEISSVGYTEEELKVLDFKYQIGRAYYYEIARNQISGDDPGLFKILFHADTLEILGVQIIGRGATEVIHIGQVAMTFNAKIDFFVDQVFNYPTYAEGYRIAALNGLNKNLHKK